MLWEAAFATALCVPGDLSRAQVVIELHEYLLYNVFLGLPSDQQQIIINQIPFIERV